MSEGVSLTGTGMSLSNPLLRLEEGSDDGSEDQEAIRTRALLFGSGSPGAAHAAGPYASNPDSSSNSSSSSSSTATTTNDDDNNERDYRRRIASGYMR